MICALLALTEITHELNEMDKSEMWSPYCARLAERCNDLTFSIASIILDQPHRKSDKEMIVKAHTLAARLERFFLRRVEAWR